MEKFDGKIGIDNLLGLVKNTAPFLFTDTLTAPALEGRFIDRGAHPMAWLSILRDASNWRPTDPTPEEKEDYFAFCICCHHATVATFVPTDVDTKIRGHLWNETHRKESLRKMFTFAQQALLWDTSKITTRSTGLSHRLSGHNGEWLSVLAGALGAFLRVGDKEWAEKAAQAIEDELAFEIKSFQELLHTKNAEIELLKSSAMITHNVGDLDQGMSYWKESPAHQAYKDKFGRLAHENDKAYDGVFQVAAHLYKRIMSPEGHRNYPLREVKGLRASIDFLFPLAPFLDDWGAKMATHPKLSDADKSELIGALLLGCKKIAGQQGYYRALSGMADALGGRFERLLERVPTALRQEAKSAEVKRHLALKKISFESSLKKRAQLALSEIGR
jgi:hypothetical protein